MRFSNTTVDATARDAWDRVMYPNRVSVRVPVIWIGGLCLPRKDGDDEVSAVFSTFTFGDNYAVEHATTQKLAVGTGNQFIMVPEPNEYRRLMLKKNLLSWSLPVPIERDNGWMTPECYERVGNVCGPLLDALLDEFYQTTIITDDEEAIMDRQCALLFSENSQGVSNACEAVSMFCTLGSFWEKFGLNKGELPEVPFKEYMMLKVIARKEGDFTRKRMRPAKGSPTKISSGGRTRPSRARSV
jgi:hypothetical protein